MSVHDRGEGVVAPGEPLTRGHGGRIRSTGKRRPSGRVGRHRSKPITNPVYGVRTADDGDEDYPESPITARMPDRSVGRAPPAAAVARREPRRDDHGVAGDRPGPGTDGWIMNLLDAWRGGPDGYLECRRCGTSLDHARSVCPACGSGDLVHYPGAVLE